MLVWRRKRSLSLKVTIADRDTLLMDAGPAHLDGPLKRPSRPNAEPADSGP